MRPRVGVDMLHYALLHEDDDVAVSYETVKRIFNVTNIGLNMNAQHETFFADDGPRETFNQIGDVDVSITTAELTGQEFADLTGASYDAATGEVDYKVTDSAPEVAIGFRSQKSNGEYRYLWLLKGTFGVPDSEFQTKEGTINFQPQTITGRFVARTFDDKVFRRIDTDDDNFVFDDIENTWFDDPDSEGTLMPLTIDSVVPANEATGVALDGTVAWTFAEDVHPADVTTDNFTLYDSENGNPVPGSVELSPDTVVTFTPDANMVASSLHVATAKAGVRGVAHGGLEEDYVTTFTTGT